MKHAHYDPQTFALLGWYSPDVHKEIPEPNFEVSEDDWQAANESGANSCDPEAKTVTYVRPSTTTSQVNAERDRRLRGSFVFQGVRFDTDPVSLQRITGAASLAGFAIAQGAQPGDLHWHGGAQPFAWITADNTVVQMDAQTCFAFGQAAAANESSLIFAAMTLKEMDPIPADYADDKHWP